MNPDAVEILAFVNQTTQSSSIEGGKVDQSRIVLTMSEVDGGWSVVNAIVV
ncbi:hypothetical protein [Stackebrandtia soli]|uniref:hypothetical protein n=1 Tax=Stackebrandtia soli TaxID=1892856 RepID=UPI0039E85303